MVIGDKGRFALEFEIREYYETDFIGDGKFLVHICGTSFGQARNDSTTFSGIIPRLGQRAEKHVTSDAELYQIDEEKLAKRFYELGYSDRNTENLTAEQMSVFQHLVIDNNIEWSAMDEAFDDGSFVLQINLPEEKVMLIGFRSVLNLPGIIGEIKSTRIAFSEFSEVVFGFIESLKSDFVQEFGHGEELAVFNWWKDARI